MASKKAAKMKRPPRQRSGKAAGAQTTEAPGEAAKGAHILTSRWVFQGKDAGAPPAEISVEFRIDPATVDALFEENKRLAAELKLLRAQYDDVAGYHVGLLREAAATARILAAYRERAAHDVAKTTTTGLLELAT